MIENSRSSFSSNSGNDLPSGSKAEPLFGSLFRSCTTPTRSPRGVISGPENMFLVTYFNFSPTPGETLFSAEARFRRIGFRSTAVLPTILVSSILNFTLPRSSGTPRRLMLRVIIASKVRIWPPSGSLRTVYTDPPSHSTRSRNDPSVVSRSFCRLSIVSVDIGKTGLSAKTCQIFSRNRINFPAVNNLARLNNRGDRRETSQG